MKLASNSSSGPSRRWPSSNQGSARPLLLALVGFVLGAGVTGLWRHSAAQHPDKEAKEGNESGVALSASTRAVLGQLNSPVEVRFYSLLDPASVSESMRAFSGRVSQLLGAYEQQSGGKIKINRFESIADSSQAASSDGVRPFNSDKGDPCFLGVTLISSGKKEVLPMLSPDWESAVEPDLSRALARLTSAPAPIRPANPPAVTPETIAAVRRQLPNLESISVTEATRVLREAALKEFQTATTEMGPQLQEAQAKILQAQSSGSATDQQAAIKQLEQLQAAQTEKLKQIAAQSKAEVEALEQLKATNR